MTKDDNLRIQDLIGVLSGVQLKQVCRVLRALPFVLDYIEEPEFANKMHELLANSAQSGEYVAPLHSRPERPNYEATTLAKENLLASGDVAEAVQHIRDLTQDPYFGQNITAPVE